MNLRRLNNLELISEIENLRGDEKLLTAKLLQYLLEIESRKLHLDMGYSSIYAFCEERLGYSKDEAYVRMQGMRLLKAVPEVAEKIESGALTLSSAAKAQSVFRRENERRREIGQTHLSAGDKRVVLAKIEGESKRESEKILAQEFPAVAIQIEERTRQLGYNSTLIQFQADGELMAKFEELKRLLAHQAYDGKWESLFTALADLALKKLKSKALATATATATATTESKFFVPERQLRETKSEKCLPVKDSTYGGRKSVSRRRRYISVHVKRVLFARADHRCEYKDRLSGNRCASTHALEIDHVKPLALGGSDDVKNLRVLCASHNKFLAQQLL